MKREHSPTSLIALGLLSGSPLHGHELRQRFEERGISAFTSLTAGALYHALRTLQAEGLIEVARTERIGARPERTVYRITDAGQAALRTDLLGVLRTLERQQFLIDVALSQCAHLPPAEVIAALEERRERQAALVPELERRQAVVEARVSTLLARSAIPRAHGMALGTSMIRHAVAHAHAELAWLDDTLRSLKPCARRAGERKDGRDSHAHPRDRRDRRRHDGRRGTGPGGVQPRCEEVHRRRVPEADRLLRR